jgi:hypothetical protein
VEPIPAPPQGISIDFIARMNRDYIKSKARGVNKVQLSTV